MSEKEQERVAAKARLNMQHGFMKSIIRNQVDRDNYDKKVKAAKAGKSKHSGHSRSKKPDIQTYRPPNSRRQGPRILLFKFEYEDKDGCIHNRDIYKDDDPSHISRSLGGEAGLTLPMMKALTDYIRSEMDNCLSEKEES